ncbi:hypothetical protein ACETIH_28565 [Microvirga arabica]|uniref:SLATT domain-containing protein n=1 Tax=Microvirga arabica TaxID=1128671 RepID=A0ABV6YHN5_9HYPH
MGSEAGFEYFKMQRRLADEAWERLFKITQWNYIAFSTAMLVSSTGLIAGQLTNKVALALVVCLFAFAVSGGAAILSYLYMNYSLHLHERVHEVEKAWLRAKDGRIFVEDRKQADKENPSIYRKRSNEMDWSKDGVRDLLENIYVQINLIPAVVSIVVAFLILLLA